MSVAVAEGLNPGVVAALYVHTKNLHVEAERSGIISDMLRGLVTREGYTLLIRNLLPVYQQIERGLDAHFNSPSLSEIASYQLDRAAAIKSDLNALSGDNWQEAIPLFDAGKAYADRIVEAAKGDGTKLIAHAYTRYLGDLSGGLILQKILARAPGLKASEMSFYQFPKFADLGALKSAYRTALDRAASFASDPDAILKEGAAAFSSNIDLSWAVKKAVGTS